MSVPKGTKKSAEDIDVKKDIALAAAEQVYTYSLIAKSVARDEDTLLKWRKQDAEFADKLEEARYRFIQKHARRAKPEFLLERLDPQNFKERKETDVKVTLPTPILGLEDVSRDDSNKED